jgi:hypothetical protein
MTLSVAADGDHQANALLAVVVFAALGSACTYTAAAAAAACHAGRMAAVLVLLLRAEASAATFLIVSQHPSQ